MKYIGTVLAGGGFGNGASAKFEYKDGHRKKEVRDIIGVLPFGGTVNTQLDKPFDFLHHKRERGFLLRIKGFIGGHTSKFNPQTRNFLNYKFPQDYEPQSCSFYKCKMNGSVDVWILRFDIDMYPKTFVEVISEHYLRRDHGLKTGGKFTLEIG